MNNKTLQQLLDNKRVKQTEMAKLLNLSESHISLLVHGKRRMNMDVAAVFAKKLEISIDLVYAALNYSKYINKQKRNDELID